MFLGPAVYVLGPLHLMTPNYKLTNVIKGRIVEDLQMNPAEVSMRFSDGSTMHVKVMESNSPPLTPIFLSLMKYAG
jgi:hypothetical protein